MEPASTEFPVRDIVTDDVNASVETHASVHVRTHGAASRVGDHDATAATEHSRQDRRWHPALRIAFRFGFIYFVLYSFPFPIGSVPGTSVLARPWNALWEALVPWVGRAVLAVPYPITVLPAGSGDTTWNYVQIFCFAVLAAAGTVLWSVVDRRRAHPKLHVWLRIYLRLVLGATMISYGAFKVIKSQFAFPSIDRLVQPFGDASPMGLLWTFMGYSDAYNVFTGLGEMTGGILLFFRRTTTLGALLLIAVLANVVILNFAFDVPMKLYSSHLLVMAILLVLPDARRLVDVLVLNRPAPAAPLAAPFDTRRNSRIADGVKLAFLMLTLGTTLNMSASARRTYGDGAPRPALGGLYETEEFVRNGVAVPPAQDDSTRWRSLLIGRNGIAVVRGMPADRRINYRMALDEAEGTLRLASLPDTSVVQVLRYRLEEGVPGAAERLVLSGMVGGDSISVRMRRRSESEFLLVNRGFHWINEYPFNR